MLRRYAKSLWLLKCIRSHSAYTMKAVLLNAFLISKCFRTHLHPNLILFPCDQIINDKCKQDLKVMPFNASSLRYVKKKFSTRPSGPICNWHNVMNTVRYGFVINAHDTLCLFCCRFIKRLGRNSWRLQEVRHLNEVFNCNTSRHFVCVCPCPCLISPPLW